MQDFAEEENEFELSKYEGKLLEGYEQGSGRRASLRGEGAGVELGRLVHKLISVGKQRIMLLMLRGRI